MASDGVVIVGAGILGSALAAVLAHEGRRVTVIERSMLPPDRIQGEALQAGGVDTLRELGLGDCLNNTDGVWYSGFTLNEENGRALPLHFEPGTFGICFRNGTFIDTLRKVAQKESTCTFIEASAIDVIEEDGGIKGVVFQRKSVKEKETLRAALTVISQGVFSTLRKVNVDGKMSKYGTIVAIEYPGTSPEHSLVFPDSTLDVGKSYMFPLFLTSDNTCFVNHITENKMRFGCNVRGGAWPADLKAYMKKELKMSSAPDHIREPVLACIDDVPISKAHTFEFHAKATFKPGVITLGDALNIRHPITGSGMTVALKDIFLWRDLLRHIPHLDDVTAMRAAHKTFMKNRKAYCLVINIYARMFHDSMYPENEEGVFLREATLDYMRWSARGKKELLEMFAITETRPSVLIYQVAVMTFYTAVRLAAREPWWKLHMGVFKGIKHVYDTWATLIPLLWTETRTFS